MGQARCPDGRQLAAWPVRSCYHNAVVLAVLGVIFVLVAAQVAVVGHLRCWRSWSAIRVLLVVATLLPRCALVCCTTRRAGRRVQCTRRSASALAVLGGAGVLCTLDGLLQSPSPSLGALGDWVIALAILLTAIFSWLLVDSPRRLFLILKTLPRDLKLLAFLLRTKLLLRSLRRRHSTVGRLFLATVEARPQQLALIWEGGAGGTVRCHAARWAGFARLSGAGRQARHDWDPGFYHAPPPCAPLSPLARHQVRLSYLELSRRANKVAQWAWRIGLRRGDVVAVLMHSRPQFVATWLGLSHLGVVASFLNPALKAASLQHGLSTSQVLLSYQSADW